MVGVENAFVDPKANGDELAFPLVCAPNRVLVAVVVPKEKPSVTGGFCSVGWISRAGLSSICTS